MKIFIFLSFLFRSLTSLGSLFWPFPNHSSKVSSRKLRPESVNFHFTRQCNYQCGFCFHTSKTSDIFTFEKTKRGLKMLKDEGMKKINFAGGEPFLYPKHLGKMVKYCKENLGLESVTIVSNGSKITEKWFQEYGTYLDILAISCDSFNEETNVKIGRGKGDHIQNVKKVQELCLEFGVKFKINTVVNKFNYQEDMNHWISELNPCRWKIFQVLILKGENSGGTDLRDATPFAITTKEFEQFRIRHSRQKSLVPENNKKMQNSYLILDEKMRFLNCTNGGKEPSGSILEVGVEKALQQSGFDSQMFVERGGVYSWSKQQGTETCSLPKDLEW